MKSSKVILSNSNMCKHLELLIVILTYIVRLVTPHGGA